MASRSSSPSEGEIVEAPEKATKSQPAAEGHLVDRPSRKRSPAPRKRTRSRSPRPNADRAFDSKRRDPRSFRVHYEERPRHGDRPGWRDGAARGPRPDDAARGDHHPRGKRARRDHAPPRGGGDRDSRRDGRRDGAWRDGSAGRDAPPEGPQGRGRDGRNAGRDAPARDSGALKVRWADAGSGDDARAEAPAEPEPEPVEPVEPVDEAALIEARRRRREAIKAKHLSAQPSPMLVQALSLSSQASPGPSQPATPAPADSEGTPPPPGHLLTLTRADASQVASPQTAASTPREASPAPAVSKDADMAHAPGTPRSDGGAEGPSAADYDPTADMREDKRRAEQRAHDDVAAAAYDETQAGDKAPAAGFDMFAEADEDDMFAEAGDPRDGADGKGKALDMTMLDDVDDPEGYYKINLGELLDGRYQVQASLGRGMFSGVVRAAEQGTGRLVAIKIIRANETMRRAAARELDIVARLNAADPEDRRHVVRLQRHFEHRGHLCMVFESLSVNLRDVLKKFGRDVGINLRAVRAYGQQLFLGLGLMRKVGVLHADLKPDNILVNEARTLLKVCDLGSAADAADPDLAAQPAPYLVSRFYRAPELILGLPPGFAIDVWSAGCTLFELFAGKILFAGRSNNQMLRAVVECRGRFPAKVLRKAPLAHAHFDPAGHLRSLEQDRSSGRDVVRLVAPAAKPGRDIRARVLAAAAKDDDPRHVALFVDLLERCLALNPDRRISPQEALAHGFLAHK